QSKGPNGVAFSNRAVLAIALSGNRVIFDEENLLELIATEGNLGQGEIFKSVRRLPAAKYVCIKGSEKISERTNEKMETDVQNPCDMDFAIHKMTEFICLAQKQYGEIVCKLTGGYDSRLNLALMKNANVPFKCFTRIPVEESEIAISLSKKLGLPHILEKRSPSLNVNIEPVSLNEGMSLPKALEIQIPPSPMFVSGAGGEFNRLYFLDVQKNSSRQNPSFKNRHQRYLSWKRKSFLKNRQIKFLARRFDARLNSLSTGKGFTYQAIDEIYLDRDRSWFGRTLSSGAGHQITPLFNSCFYQFGRRFPPRERLNSLPHQKIISKLIPQCRDIPYYSAKKRPLSRFFSKVPSELKAKIRAARWSAAFGKHRTIKQTYYTSVLAEIFEPWQIASMQSLHLQYRKRVDSLLKTEEYIQKINRVI
ncbi:hypothetical protein N9V88_02420, partial [bacterium]|nr:hypothetical protein [bacterium]